MHTIATRAHADRPARCLLILLPGLGDSAGDFADHGFIAALRKRNLSVDSISANATLGYYARETLIERLETDVLAPARKVGYEQIWVAGISLGGMGSVLLAESHASELTGLILIAPYLGDDKILDEIESSGGVAHWKAGKATGDYRREMWRWLQGAIARPASAPAIYLASGDQDRLRRGHRLLAEQLPRNRVFRTIGNHDWGPWSVLWDNVLDRSDFAAQCTDSGLDRGTLPREIP
jgi:pimeloyl-ACP methyl ester carboxylesterase